MRKTKKTENPALQNPASDTEAGFFFHHLPEQAIKSVIFVNKKDKDEIRFSISSIRTLKDRLEKNGNLT